MKAMILAAGRGKRMGYLTQSCPKPLLKVKGRCLIDWHLSKLCEAGFKDVVINVSYLSKEIIEFVGDGSNWGLNISISEEIEALETAGGIKKAIKYLGDDPFVVINADIFSMEAWAI
jgi:MurNAc alpha-1-phosphate uridylyltransferase